MRTPPHGPSRSTPKASTTPSPNASSPPTSTPSPGPIPASWFFLVAAHTEAGWMSGRGKRTIVYIPEMVEPELMYKLFDGVVGSMEELVEVLSR